MILNHLDCSRWLVGAVAVIFQFIEPVVVVEGLPQPLERHGLKDGIGPGHFPEYQPHCHLAL